MKKKQDRDLYAAELQEAVVGQRCKCKKGKKLFKILYKVLSVALCIVLIFTLFGNLEKSILSVKQELNTKDQMLEKKMDSFKDYLSRQMMYLNKTNKQQTNATNYLKKQQLGLKEELKETQKIDNKEMDRILASSICIFNYSLRALGSGTVIKIKNKYYVLTCAHLIGTPKDIIWGEWNDKSRFPLELINYDKITDLAVFRVHKARIPAYLELSDIEPNVGSMVTVVGNPGGIRQIVTDGIISKKVNNNYIFTNTIYFGNSGGCLLYKNKVVAVVTNLIALRTRGCLASYGLGRGLTLIRRFLADSNIL